MSERKDEKWLDNQLQRAIDGSTPAFDAEAWKRKHREEFRTLLARGKQDARSRWGKPHPTLWIGRLAVAAVVAVAVGLFVLGRNGHGPDKPPVSPGPVAESSPARMMSMMSLRMAYQRGGFDAVDRQLQDTLDEFRPRSSTVSVQELF
jgi:hypothetical protein